MKNHEEVITIQDKSILVANDRVEAIHLNALLPQSDTALFYIC